MVLSYRLSRPPAAARAIVVAIHGLAESAECLQAAFPHWVSRGWAVLAVDLRGHGSSPRWSDEDLQKHPGDVMVLDVLDVLRSADLRDVAGLPAFYYGHSAGGSVAAAVAAAVLDQAAVPDQVRPAFSPAAVLLEDPFWRLPVTPLQDPSVAEAAYAHLLKVQACTAAERTAIRRREWPNWSEAEILRSTTAQENCDPRLIRNGNVIPSTPWPDLTASLTAADVPVLVITGTVRAGITPEHQRMARESGARVGVFHGASHFVRRDMEDTFMRASTAFFAEALELKESAQEPPGQPLRKQTRLLLGHHLVLHAGRILAAYGTIATGSSTKRQGTTAGPPAVVLCLTDTDDIEQRHHEGTST